MHAPLAYRLRKIFPAATITFICADDHLMREAAGRLPAFDAVEPNLSGSAYRIYNAENRKRFDLILTPNTNTIVFRRPNARQDLISILYACIGLGPSDDNPIEYSLTAADLSYGSSFREKYGDYIVIHTDCSPYTHKKEWARESWQELIDMQTGPVIVIGTSTNEFKNCIDMRNKTTVHEMASIIKYCFIFVGIVSGPYWFTNAFGKEAVVINGGFEAPSLTRHARSHHLYSDIPCAPCYTPEVECQHGMRCMRMITPQMVNKEITKAKQALRP